MSVNAIRLLKCTFAVLPLFFSIAPEMATAAGNTQASLPQELVVVRSQPSVFKVIAVIDLRATYPAQVLIRKDTSDGGEVSSLNWDKIVSSPEQYLQASSENEIASGEDVKYGSGTAFAISREGILLTNAHVVKDPDKADILRLVFNDWFKKAVTDLTAQLGKPPDVDPETVKEALGDWLYAHGEASGKFKQALVVLNFGASEQIRKISSTKVEDYLSVHPDAEVVSAKVLSIGTPYPGNDVAILKLDTNETVKDRLICLPLGDSDQVLPGTKVHAFGFPGGAFLEGEMDPEARYRMSVENGEVTNTKQMASGWSYFEMSADINHGDSGGPVIDEQGNVIALNVAVTKIASHTLAVPINIAKALLRQAGVNPSQSPITKDWLNGLSLFSAGRFAEAKKEFDHILVLQSDPFAAIAEQTGVKPLAPGNSFSKWANPYVQEMERRCAQKLGQFPSR